MAARELSYDLRCSEEERAAWDRAAKSDGRKLADWMRRTLNRAEIVQRGGEEDAPKAAGAAGPAPVAAPAAPAGNPAALAPEVEDVRHPPKMKLGWNE